MGARVSEMGSFGWPEARAGAVLTVDLGAVQANYRLLAARASGAVCAGVVKADAYGLGADQVGPALWQAGCRVFFVAHGDEGIVLRRVLDPSARIYVLHGPLPGTEGAFVAHGLAPVLNSLDQIAGWRSLARKLGRSLAAILQVDTGMARFGLAADELDRIVGDPSLIEGIELCYVMSHLARAEAWDQPSNGRQRERFLAALARLPKIRASLANSSGIFLGSDYHFDLVRPGAALYGVAPVAGQANPLAAVIRLQGKIVQTRMVGAGEPVGYGETFVTTAPTRIAAVAVGYADGFLRAASNRGSVWMGDVRLPIIGAVSMDSITIDITALPEAAARPGCLVDLVGPHYTVDDAGRAGGTIAYEFLTNLGARYHRCYINGLKK